MSVVPRETESDGLSIKELIDTERTLECRVPCECCGAAVTLVDEGVATCAYCCDQRIVGTMSETAIFIPFARSPEQALVEMKRWLRLSGHRATSVARVASVLVPYWRINRRVLVWHAEAPDALTERTFEAATHFSEHFEPAIGACEALGADLPFEDRVLTAFPLDRSLIADGTLIAKVTSDPSTLPDFVPPDALGGTDQEGDEGLVTDREPSEFVPGGEPESLEDALVGDDSDASATNADAEDDESAAEASSPAIETEGWSSEEAFTYTTEIERSVTRVYVPFYNLRYTFEGRHHSVVACGRTGRVTGVVDGEFKESHPLADREEVFGNAGMPATRPLDCPSCKGRLLATGALLTCRSCNSAFRIERGELLLTASEIVDGEGHRLPFWRFVQTQRAGGRVPSLHVDLDESEAPRAPRHIWVPAFAPCPAVLARKLAVLVSEPQSSYESHPGAPRREPHAICRTPSSAAKPIAELVVRELEGRLDSGVGPVSPVFDGVEPMLIWIPFNRQNGFLTDPVSGVRIADAILTP